MKKSYRNNTVKHVHFKILNFFLKDEQDKGAPKSSSIRKSKS